MEQRGAPEFILEAFADPNSVRDVVRGKKLPTTLSFPHQNARRPIISVALLLKKEGIIIDI
jgi:hypothetical protein